VLDRKSKHGSYGLRIKYERKTTAGAKVLIGGIMEQAQIESFKQLFIDIKNHHARNAIDLEGELAWNKGGDEVDLVNRERDRELLLKLQGRNRFYLKKVDEALSRIEAGTFGECVDCGQGIEMNRLQARPTATHCIGCKEAQEREEGHILYSKRSHTQGQEIVNNNVVRLPTSNENQRAV